MLARVVVSNENFEGESPYVVAPLSFWASQLGEFPWFATFFKVIVWPLVQRLFFIRIRVPSGFSLAPRWTWQSTSDSTNRKQRQRWDAWQPPLLPPSGWKRLVEHIDCRAAIRVNVRRRRMLCATLVATLGNVPLFYARRKFFGSTVMVENTYLVISKNARKGGLGMQLTANALAVYQRMGFRQIQLKAGLTDGGSVWARVGYVPTDSKQWGRVKKAVRINFSNLPIEIQNSSSAAAHDFREQLDIILDSKDPAFIRQILRLDADGKVRAEGKLSEDLSKFLLRKSRWRGRISFDDPESIGWAREYLNEKIAAGRVRQPEWW